MGDQSIAEKVIDAIIAGDVQYVREWAQDASGEHVIPLLETARNHDQIECIRALLDGGPWTINVHHHAWMTAIEMGQRDVVEALLEYMPPNEPMDWAMISACRHGHHQVVAALMGRASSEDMEQGLIQSIHRGFVRVLDLLAPALLQSEHWARSVRFMERAAVTNNKDVIDVLYKHWGQHTDAVEHAIVAAHPFLNGEPSYLQQLHQAHVDRQELGRIVDGEEQEGRGRRKM